MVREKEEEEEKERLLPILNLTFVDIVSLPSFAGIHGARGLGARALESYLPTVPQGGGAKMLFFLLSLSDLFPLLCLCLCLSLSLSVSLSFSPPSVHPPNRWTIVPVTTSSSPSRPLTLPPSQAWLNECLWTSCSGSFFGSSFLPFSSHSPPLRLLSFVLAHSIPNPSSCFPVSSLSLSPSLPHHGRGHG